MRNRERSSRGERGSGWGQGVAARALALLLIPVGVGAVAAASRAARAGSWRILETSEAARTATALAAHRDSGALVFGDLHGVFALGADGRTRLRLRRGPVRDLAFLDVAGSPEPLLIAATARGLYRIDASDRARAISLGPGSASREVQRLASSRGLVAAAGEDGVFVSADARRWRRLDGLPAGPAQALALREVAGGHLCFSASGAELWQSFIAANPGAETHADARAPLAAVSRRIGAAAPGEGAVVDLAADVPGAALVVLRERSLAALGSDGRFAELSPVLAPGAQLRRLLAFGDDLWLASDRGLAVSRSLGGPWQLAPGVAARAEVRALAFRGEQLYAASSLGILVEGEPPAAPAAGVRSAAPRPLGGPAAGGFAREPGIAQVHRAAVDYLGLRRDGIEDLARGVRRRGWLPVLALHAGYQRDRSQGSGYDQSFTSGALRDLEDHDWGGGREFDLQLVATWDLGDAAYHPEAIDVAREERERIELRDDVLDELNQLYFERRRVLAELALEVDPDSPTALRLRLRAEELAAGIDGWTGGWFSQQLAADAPRADSPGPDERQIP